MYPSCARFIRFILNVIYYRIVKRNELLDEYLNEILSCMLLTILLTICSMFFYSRGFGRQGWGRDNKPLEIWKLDKYKKIWFFAHFNVDYEFNQLANTWNLFLGSSNVSCQPSISHGPSQSPFHSHPNIHEIPVQNVANDGWEEAPWNQLGLEHQLWG